MAEGRRVPSLQEILDNKNKLFWSQDQIFDALNNKTKIVLYEQLPAYSNVDHLLGEYNNVVVFIPIAEEKEGHWVCIIRNQFGVEFFDSYGHAPSEITARSTYIRESGIDPHVLDSLLATVNDLTINRVKFQEKSSDINTCGRHISVRIFFSLLSNSQYHEFLTTKKYDYDDLVTLMTLLV